MTAPEFFVNGVPDPSGALSRFERAFPTLRVEVVPGARGFGFDYRSVVTDQLAINWMRCVGRVRAIGPLPEVIAVARRSAGAVSVAVSGRACDTSWPFLRPTASAELEVSDGAAMLIALQRSTVTEYMLRSGERGIAMNRLQTVPHFVALGFAMRHAEGFLLTPDALTSQAAEELQDLLCWSLLQAFEDPWTETHLGGARSSVLRRAMVYMEEYADGVVTMPKVAEAARTSVRSLGLLFRRELDTSPMLWLRDLRLDRARLDLLAGTGSVAEIAARRGLPTGGHFAAQYEARFAEQPAVTLRGATESRIAVAKPRHARYYAGG